MGKNQHKVNIRARIDRHSRSIKENITLKNRIFSVFKRNNLIHRIIILCLLISIPLYPMFASIIHNNNEIDFYRWYIDEDSILWTYSSYYLREEEISSWDSFIETQDEFLMDTGILSEDRDYKWTNEILTYKVEEWDTISEIASKFGISWDTIRIYNDLKTDTINPWKQLKIPPVSGIPYKIKSWDSLLAIANKYKIDKNSILEFNDFDEQRKLKIWEEIFLPGAKKIIIKKPVYKAPVNKRYSKVDQNKQYIGNQYTNSKGVYKLVWRKPFSGVWGNCTYYVASYKNVNWRGNANQWMRNAAAKWHKVVYGRGFKPELWAIVSLAGRWYNLRYGHVAIVMEVKDNYMIVSDMNYKKLNEVTYRKIDLKDRRIVWYIYVD